MDCIPCGTGVAHYAVSFDVVIVRCYLNGLIDFELIRVYLSVVKNETGKREKCFILNESTPAWKSSTFQVLKCFIQKRNNVIRVKVEPRLNNQRNVTTKIFRLSENMYENFRFQIK